MSMERDTNLPMTLSRFAALADAYGGKLQHWPEDEQDKAEAFIRDHADQAQPVLRDAAALDAVLDQGRIIPEPALYETIVATGLRKASTPPRWAGLAAAVALVFGAGAGWFSVEPVAPADDAAYFADAFSVLSETDSSLLEETS